MSPAVLRGGKVKAMGLPIVHRSTTPRGGWTLIELLATSLVLSFVIASTVRLYTVWERESLMVRNYSQAQTDSRTAFRVMMRAVRHGNNISTVAITVGASTMNSDATHIIVNVPQPGNTATDVLFYTDAGGTLKYIRRTDAAPTSIISGVTAFTIRYFQTTTTGAGNARVATTTELAAATPGNATEAEITLTVRSGGPNINTNEAAVTKTTAYVTLRNTARMQTTSP